MYWRDFNILENISSCDFKLCCVVSAFYSLIHTLALPVYDITKTAVQLRRLKTGCRGGWRRNLENWHGTLETAGVVARQPSHMRSEGEEIT
jgi:hypothetical protein